MPRYVHEEIKQKPTKMKAKIEEEVMAEKSLRKKKVKIENEAYEKLVILNEAYKQELVARGIDTMAIKAKTEKRFAEQKHIRQRKEEPQIERKDEAEKEEGEEDEVEKEGDETQYMSIELEEPKEVKVAEKVPKKKKGRKRKEESDDTLKEFVQGLRAKSQRTTKKPKFLESPFQTEMPKKKRKGKTSVVVVKDDDDKVEKDEEKPLAISHLDFDIRLPGTIDEEFYHNFTVQDVPNVSNDENKWLQYFLTLKVDKRTVFEVEDQTICRYDMLHLLRGGRLKEETVEALVARLQKWLKLPENAHVDRKFAIVMLFFSIWLLTASNLDKRNVYKII
ncbi:uncharacterized protein A4U43_C06F12990 [Asparagus officinalis]|uniref:Uncharacterized protein n=1 Tax=Asparagus officinalis TaxID=4686 RepID=A0A5P1EQ01_ASPOF|nr:uncharacterized protein A4U43_C06F12990 [Asparagus officinalis]